MIVLGIVVSIALGWICSRFSLERRRFLLIVISCFFAGSEVGKQVLLYIWNDYRYIWWYFPFQLCSLPLYLLPAALFLNSSFSHVRMAIFAFLADFGTLAGIFVFVDTSGMYYQLPVLTVHSFLWHYLMIFTGVLVGLSPEFSKAKAHFRDACIIFMSGAGIAQVINWLFHNRGSINMFYISPWEPVTQAVFRNIAEATGNSLCHIVYLAVIIAGAGIVHNIFCNYSAKHTRTL